MSKADKLKARVPRGFTDRGAWRRAICATTLASLRRSPASGRPSAAHGASLPAHMRYDVSVIGLGTWQLGADWGAVSEDDAMAGDNAIVVGALAAGGADGVDDHRGAHGAKLEHVLVCRQVFDRSGPRSPDTGSDLEPGWVTSVTRTCSR